MANSLAQASPEVLSSAQHTTLAAFNEIDERTLLELTELTLPEIRAIKQEVANVLPVGNLPAMILSGLTQIKGRKVVSDRVRQDVSALLRGMNLLPQGLFGVFVAGPATVLYAYQKILRLAGKDVDSAFPQGMWQFYLEFSLREDAARHANETCGFHQAFPRIDNPVQAAAAWVGAAIDVLYHYNDLLAIDWRERVMLRTVREQAELAGIADQKPLSTILRDWDCARPYRCPPNRSDYLRYRLETFDVFLQERSVHLPESHRQQVGEIYVRRHQEEFQSYVEQMTLLASLTPDQYQERKEPIPLWRAFVGLIWQGRTYLLPVCRRDASGSPLCFLPDEHAAPLPLFSHVDGLCDAQHRLVDTDGGGRVWYRDNRQPLGNLRPPSPESIQSQVAAILAAPTTGAASELDLLLATCPRSVQAQLRKGLPEATQAELGRLRRAPILINWDLQSSAQPLSHIRRGRRGIGDHALTITRTDTSMVFDQSHIFFDGMWGSAIAEIMTNFAIIGYRQLAQSAPVTPVSAFAPLQLHYPPQFAAQAQKHIHPAEAAAESDGIQFEGVKRLRKWLDQRGVHLTVNDLLLLYRIFHASQYTLSDRAEKALIAFQKRVKSSQHKAVKESLEQTLARFKENNPSLLIPMDASNVSPRERLYPTTFRNPLPDLPAIYAAARDSYHKYRQADTPESWQDFDQQRRQLLAYLQAFGGFCDTLKAVTMRGESFNSATMHLLGHLPPAMQHLLDQIPQHIGVLNEVIKGNEVFSNVGRVAPGSSLRRFVSAKDDGIAKELVWGILTDDTNCVRVTLRDFRPFAALLLGLGEGALADLLSQDYLLSYVQGFNRFVSVLGTLVAVKSPF